MENKGTGEKDSTLLVMVRVQHFILSQKLRFSARQWYFQKLIAMCRLEQGKEQESSSRKTSQEAVVIIQRYIVAWTRGKAVEVL